MATTDTTNRTDVPAGAGPFLQFMREHAPPSSVGIDVWQDLYRLFAQVLKMAPSEQIGWQSIHTLLTTPLSLLSNQEDGSQVCYGMADGQIVTGANVDAGVTAGSRIQKPY